MKKTNVIIGCLIFVFLVAMCSCGARKVNKKSFKEETKTELIDNLVTDKQTETNIKTETKIIVDDKNESVTTETTYSPEDPTKEAYVIEKDGIKVILGNSKKTVKTETKKNNTQTTALETKEEVKKDVYKERKDVVEVTEAKKENSSKEVKKDTFNVFNLLWLLIPIVIIYIFYRIYKKLPII